MVRIVTIGKCMQLSAHYYTNLTIGRASDHVQIVLHWKAVFFAWLLCNVLLEMILAHIMGFLVQLGFISHYNVLPFLLVMNILIAIRVLLQTIVLGVLLTMHATCTVKRIPRSAED